MCKYQYAEANLSRDQEKRTRDKIEETVVVEKQEEGPDAEVLNSSQRGTKRRLPRRHFYGKAERSFGHLLTVSFYCATVTETSASSKMPVVVARRFLRWQAIASSIKDESRYLLSFIEGCSSLSL
jgi:hypothetical protein